jgi:hypothetical protein
MKGKHYDTTTLSYPLSHTKTLSYINTIKYLLPTLLTNYYLKTNLPYYQLINIFKNDISTQ